MVGFAHANQQCKYFDEVEKAAIQRCFLYQVFPKCSQSFKNTFERIQYLIKLVENNNKTYWFHSRLSFQGICSNLSFFKFLKNLRKSCVMEHLSMLVFEIKWLVFQQTLCKNEKCQSLSLVLFQVGQQQQQIGTYAFFVNKTAAKSQSAQVKAYKKINMLDIKLQWMIDCNLNPMGLLLNRLVENENSVLENFI